MQICNDQSFCFTANLHACWSFVKALIERKLQVDSGKIKSISIELAFSEVMELREETVDSDFEKLSDFSAIIWHIVVVGKVVVGSSYSPSQLLQCWFLHAFKSRTLDISYNHIINFNEFLENCMVFFKSSMILTSSPSLSILKSY